jgi:hypothetical protein
MEEVVKESDVRVEAPVADKKFNGLIAFSLNKLQYASVSSFLVEQPGKNLQLKIKSFVLLAANDNKVSGVGVNGGQEVR